MFEFIPLFLGNLLGGGAAAEGAEGATSGSPMSLILMVGLFAVMYFVMIRPQKKKQKEEQQMRDTIQIGDEITTIGGIMGRVVTVKEDSIVLELCKCTIVKLVSDSLHKIIIEIKVMSNSEAHGKDFLRLKQMVKVCS